MNCACVSSTGGSAPDSLVAMFGWCVLNARAKNNAFV